MTSRPRYRIGTLLALVTLVLRLAFPAGAMPAAAPLPGDGLLGDVPICHSGTAPAPAGSDLPVSDCTLCPLCHIVAAPALVPPSTAQLPLPEFATDRVAFVLPPSTGPPAPERYAARPRGPPAPLV